MAKSSPRNVPRPMISSLRITKDGCLLLVSRDSVYKVVSWPDGNVSFLAIKAGSFKLSRDSRYVLAKFLLGEDWRRIYDRLHEDPEYDPWEDEEEEEGRG